MSTGGSHPSVRYQRDNEPENGSSSPVDEGAILLEHQVNHPEGTSQNMASPSVNTEPTKNRMSDGSSVVDMVLVYEVPDPATLDKEKEQQEEADKVKKREFYIDGLKAAGLIVEIDQLGNQQSEVRSFDLTKECDYVVFNAAVLAPEIPRIFLCCISGCIDIHVVYRITYYPCLSPHYSALSTALLIIQLVGSFQIYSESLRLCKEIPRFVRHHNSNLRQQRT